MESKLHMTILDISDVDIETLNTTTGIDTASNAENKYNKLVENDDVTNGKYTNVHTKLFSKNDFLKTSIYTYKKLLNCEDIDWNNALMPNCRKYGLIAQNERLTSYKLLWIINSVIEKLYPTND